MWTRFVNIAIVGGNAVRTCFRIHLTNWLVGTPSTGASRCIGSNPLPVVAEWHISDTKC